MNGTDRLPDGVEEAPETWPDEPVRRRGRDGAAAFRTILTILLIVLTALVSSLVTIRSMERIYARQEYAPLLEAEEVIRKHYYFLDEQAPREELTASCVQNALEGMIDGLGDVYADYMTAEEFDKLMETDSGEYRGIGILVEQPGEAGSRVLRVYEGAPAEEAGVLAGDLIVTVNGSAAAGLSMDAFMDLFADGEDEEDVLVLRRGEETYTVTLAKREVRVPRVRYERLDNGYGYIRLEEFTGDVANELSRALDALTDLGVPGAVIDLRENPGGDLAAVLGTLDCILDKGDPIATIRDRQGGEVSYSAKTSGIDLPIAVLVNGNSASGSEMFSGALQDNGRAVIVGTRTFGKGIVQTFYRLRANGGWVKLTSDAYFTPGGAIIHGQGILPDVVVELPQELDEDGDGWIDIDALPHDRDTQLQAALGVLGAASGEKAA